MFDIWYFGRKRLICSGTDILDKKSFAAMIIGLYTWSEICGVVLLSYLTAFILNVIVCGTRTLFLFWVFFAIFLSKNFKFAYCLGD